jgi:hypothetical protein
MSNNLRKALSLTALLFLLAALFPETDVDIFAFRNAHFQNAGDFLGLPIDDTGQQ